MQFEIVDELPKKLIERRITDYDKLMEFCSNNPNRWVKVPPREKAKKVNTEYIRIKKIVSSEFEVCVRETTIFIRYLKDLSGD